MGKKKLQLFSSKNCLLWGRGGGGGAPVTNLFSFITFRRRGGGEGANLINFLLAIFVFWNFGSLLFIFELKKIV